MPVPAHDSTRWRGVDTRLLKTALRYRCCRRPRNIAWRSRCPRSSSYKLYARQEVKERVNEVRTFRVPSRYTELLVDRVREDLALGCGLVAVCDGGGGNFYSRHPGCLIRAIVEEARRGSSTREVSTARRGCSKGGDESGGQWLQRGRGLARHKPTGMAGKG